MALGGAFLRIAQMGIRAIQFLTSVLVLGVFSYFLIVLKNHDLQIATWIKAVEGIAGAAVLYTGFAVVLTLCLGGISFFAFLAILLDLCFVGCFAAVAVLNRGGDGSCNGDVNTPLGDGPSDPSHVPNLHRACVLEKSVFAVAIANIVLFLISPFVQYHIGRHHQKEKRFGPSPANNYTAGSGGRPFWRRNRVAREAEVGAVGAGALAAEKHGHHHLHPSHDTGYTGTTAEAPLNTYSKYDNGPAGYPTHGYAGQTQGVTRTTANF